MISSIIDQIPWWVYLVVVLIGAGAAWYFLAPILLPLWKITPNWVKVALAFIFALFLAFIKGRNTGRSNAVKEQEKRNAEGERKREELHEQIERADPSDIDKRLNKWMRD